MDTTTIIARYNEDISWANDIKHFVVQKGKHMPNYGREPMSFLWYIINHYDELEGNYAFVQGNPFDHYPYVDNPLWCTNKCCVHHPGLPWEKFNNESEVKLPEVFQFHPGGQFAVSTRELKKYPKPFYENLAKLIDEDELIAWVLERVWKIIFNVL